MFFFKRFSLLCFGDIKSELGSLLFFFHLLKSLFAFNLLLQFLTHNFSLKCKFFLTVLLLSVVSLQILQNNLIPLSLSHAVRLLDLFLLSLTRTFLRVLSLAFCKRLNGYVTFNRLSVFCMSFRNATSSIYRAADSFIESAKLILTYVSLYEDQLLDLVLDQSIEIAFRVRVNLELVAELVNQKLGKLLALGLLFVFLVVVLGL